MKANNSRPASLEDAILLCKAIENKCPDFGYHVALTGGCLYKYGDRKDIDIMFPEHLDTGGY